MKISPKAGLAFAVLLLVGSLSLALSLAFCDPSSGNGDGTHRKEDSTVTTSLDYEYKTDISAYADAMNTTDASYLLLANKNRVVGENYVPDDLIQLDTKYTLNGKEISLSGNAAAAATAAPMRPPHPQSRMFSIVLTSFREIKAGRKRA